MRKAIFYIVALLLGLSHCRIDSDQDSRTIITKKIQYDVPIMNPDATQDWWVKNIAGPDREELINSIFDRVLSGEIKAYDYFDVQLSVNDVERIMSDTITRRYVRPYPPYPEYDTTIIVTIERSDITMLRFVEEWKYDKQSLQIDKKIFAISPVIEVEVDGKEFTRPLYWIYFDDSVLK